MTVLLTVPVARRPWRGSDNPALPSGVWLASGQSTGDATGGTNIISFRFRQLGEPFSGIYYSLEELSLSEGSTTSKVCRMRLAGMDWMNPGVVGREIEPRNWNLNSAQDGVGSSLALNQVVNRTVFLGTPSGFNTATSNLAFDVPNVNAQGFTVFASGYIWSPEAALQPGGLQKPPNGLWT